MADRGKKRTRKGPILVVALLILLAAMFPLGDFFAGILGGGGRRDADDAAETRRAAGTLLVTVLSAETQAPVTGAKILAIGLDGKSRSAVSDGGGRAAFEGLEGPVRLEVDHEGLRAMAWTNPATGGTVELRAAPEKTRHGQVRFADGRAARARVRLMDETGVQLDAVETGPDGRYALRDRPGARSLSVEPDDAAPAVASDGDVVVDQGQPVEGRLIGAGAGALEVYGLAPQPDDDAMLPFRCEWKVNADGSFAGRIPKGVRAWGRYAGLPFELKPGDIALPKTIVARGRVMRADGAAAKKAVLHFRPLLDADFPVPLPAVRVVANDDGAFSVPGFADGRYAVEVRAEGCATTVVADMKPGAGPFQIKMGKGFSLEGRVVDAAGLPVPTADIRAVCLPDEKGELPVARTRAGVSGRFALTGLGGEYARVQVTAPGHHPTTLDGVRPAPGLRIILQKR